VIDVDTTVLDGGAEDGEPGSALRILRVAFRQGEAMSVRFSLCPACARHVKQSDRMCPFCGNEVPPVNAPARVVVGRLSRSALFAAGAAGLALAATDCGSMGAAYGGPVCASADGSDTCNIMTFVNDGASEDAADASSSTSDAAVETGSNDGGSLEAASDAAVIPTDAFSDGS